MLIGYACIDTDKITEYAKEHPQWTGDHWQDYFYFHQKDIPVRKTGGVGDPLSDSHDMKLFLGLAAHLAATGQKLGVYMRDDLAAVIGYSGKKFVLPAELVAVEPLTDYTDVPAGQIAAIGQGGVMELPAVPENTQSALNKKAADTEAQLDLLKKREKEIQDCTAPGMEDLKKQLDELMENIRDRQSKLMTELRKKQEELDAEKKRLNKELFILETQIYGIRCYLGEVVSFHTVRGGKPAAADLPVVIYQKIRYLDEELGKYLSLYGCGSCGDDKEQFLEILKTRDDIADLVCPGPKSISAVRISRTGTVKGASDKVVNALRDYELYHDNQLAVMIRNGEQIHISWLDADRISVWDENLFFRPGETESRAYNGQGDSEMEPMEYESPGSRNEMISRWFFFAVLQGVIDNTSLINLPEKTRITDMRSPYIKFSTAEGWVADTRYGSFADMMKKSSHIPLREGDAVLTGTRIHRDDYRTDAGRAWSNNRGIGNRNRTAGASLPGKTVMPINRVIPCLSVKYAVKVCRAYLETIPDGRTMYEYDGGKCRTSYLIQDRDDAVVVKLPDYRIVYTDEVMKEEETTKTVGGEDWLFYARWNNSRSYRSLSKEQLMEVSGISRAIMYIDDCGRERWACGEFDGKKAAYELQEKGIRLFYRKVTDAVILGETEHEYYCTARTWGARGEYNVNFRIYDGEMIPLTFLCSTWLNSVVTSGDTGWYCLCDAGMSYADMLPYLNIALTHIREREKDEKARIEEAGGGEWLKENPDWDAVLCEWKISRKCHVLTKRRAAQFLRDCASPSGRDNAKEM